MGPRVRGDDVVRLFAGGTQNIIGKVRTIGRLTRLTLISSTIRRARETRLGS